MDNNQVKVSVIMPSLNVCNYIEECILSVTNQTLSEIEIICVDAGSTDGTLEILKKYAKKDSRITVLMSDEKSYGHQVNLGISNANGEYISIIETDDFIDEDMLKFLYNLSDNNTVDIIKGSFYHYNDSDSENIVYNIDNVKSNLPTFKKFTLNKNPIFIDGHPSIWAGIYRREFLEDNNINFVEVPAGGWVDNPFFYETALAAESIVYVHKPFYYYRVSNPNSSSNSLHDFTIPMDRVLDMFKIIERYRCNDENILVMFYNRLFRYIEIILENNNNSDKNLDYKTCNKIHEVVEKVDENIVINKLKFNFQKIYYKYMSPLFLARFNKPSNFSNLEYEFLFKENEFLHSNVTYFRNQFNEVNYKNSILEKEYSEAIQSLNSRIVKIIEDYPHIKPTKSLVSKSTEPKVINDSITKFDKLSNAKYPISVIIPVFNGAKFLKRSIDSLLNQTLKDFEIVFINDGSTDNSLQILQRYEKKYDFIKVLNQENLGSGKARNYGITEAEGEYIAFLDADDFFMDDDALEKMYRMASLNNANMVTANIKHDLENEGDFIPFGPFHYYTSNDVILPEQYGIPWSFYKNIFKKEFLIENNIYFPDLLRGQDPVFLAEVLTKVDKIYVVATDLYAYVYNSDTAKANNPRKLYDQILHYKQVIDYLDTPTLSRRREEYFEKIILFLGRLDDDSVIDAIKSIRKIFKDMPDFERQLENHLYLKFSHVKDVKKLISWTKISVIMDIYNSKNAKKSIDSILNQTIEDIELILLNNLENDEFNDIIELFGKVPNVKFIDSDEVSLANLRNYALDEANGDYVYFSSDDHIFENNFFEELFKTSVVSGSEICLCNLPKCETKSGIEINFKSIFGNVNYEFFTFKYERIIPYLFSSSCDLSLAFYKKSFLNGMYFNNKLIDCSSVFLIESILNSNILSFVPKFLFNYLKSNNIYYNFVKMPKGCNNALNIFEVCDNIEEFLKEKSLYDNFKTNFDIYKINQITSFLDYVRFVGCYSYNDPKNRNLFANGESVLDYSQYYGSKSENVGLNYSYANEYFLKSREEFIKLNYTDLNFLDLHANKFSNENSLNKYLAVLKSNSYEEYMDMVNFSVVENLMMENSKLKENSNNSKSLGSHMIEEMNELSLENSSLEEEISKLEEKNKILVKRNNELREEYWENRDIYNQITSSKSWKYTKILRRD